MPRSVRAAAVVLSTTTAFRPRGPCGATSSSRRRHSSGRPLARRLAPGGSGYKSASWDRLRVHVMCRPCSREQHASPFRCWKYSLAQAANLHMMLAAPRQPISSNLYPSNPSSSVRPPSSELKQMAQRRLPEGHGAFSWTGIYPRSHFHTLRRSIAMLGLDTRA